MNRIVIEGLNPHQHKLMDAIWAMESYDEVMAFRMTLHPLMRRELDVLLELLRYESLEEDIQEMKQFPETMRLINRIKKRHDL
jgi:hypothetical protein